MKKMLFFLLFLSGLYSPAQSNNPYGATKSEIILKDFSVEMTFNTLEEIQGFQAEEFSEILETVQQNAPLSFKIIYIEKDGEEPNGNKISYTVKGNSNDPDTFLRNINKTINSFENYIIKNKS